jgi:hypothetical protein
MAQELFERLMHSFEPAAQDGLLFYPLRFGSGLAGFLSIEWWESGPRNHQEVHQLLQIAVTPFAFLLSGGNGPPTQLAELAGGLRQLSQAVAEPGDIFQRLSSCLRSCLDFECLVAWAASDQGFHRVLSDPPGQYGFEADALNLLNSTHDEQKVGKAESNSFLCLALKTEQEVLGAVALSRGAGNDFSHGERELATSLVRLAQGFLLNARVFGVQSRLLEKTRYRYLAAQIRPHFLFNALNTLASLVAVDPEQAEELILDTAEFLRTTFTDRPEMVPLSEELRFLEIYLKLEKARFGERLSFHQEVEASALGALVPALTLQPLVENAVRHGVTPKAEGGQIVLSIVSENVGHRVRIIDDGLGFEPGKVRPTGTGVGLENVRERLQKRFGEACRWELRSTPGEGTQISFSVPSGDLVGPDS